MRSYDRAGYGWSEVGLELRTSGQIVDELSALLTAAEEPGPYVVAGHSFGGLNMTLFAATHPDDVVGIVLIDSSHPGQTEALAAAAPDVMALQDAEIAGLGELATAVEAGEVAAADVVGNAPALPDELTELWAAMFVQPRSLETAVAEYGVLVDSMAEIDADGSLGDIPLVDAVTSLLSGEAAPATTSVG